MSTPEFESIRIEVDADTVVATLCRPDRLNAVGAQLLDELAALARWLHQRDDVHFLILDHDGPVFSAGAHLREAHQTLSDPAHARARLRANQRAAQDMVAKLSSIDQISFAAVRGSAYGAGLGIAMTCDFRVMAESAVFSLPETKLGMFLTYGLTPSLVNTIGLARAKEMILFAEDWPASRCLEVGAADRVVPADQVRPTIERMIDTLRQRSWPALRTSKQVANAAAAARFGDVTMCEPELAAEALAAGDVRDRVGDFLKRRGPR